MMDQFTPEYIQFWLEVGPRQFFRVFWYFILFELTRYVLLDFGVAAWLWTFKKSKQEKWDIARRKFWNENPFVSIIVPGKNEGKHLFKLTRSLAEQTFQNFELIVVDDGSDDDTSTIGRNLQKRGLIDVFIRNDVRGGKASAANLALRFSKGKFIIHLDADCSFDRQAIENSLIPFYLDEKIGAVGGNVKVRNHSQSICTRLQAIEYLKTISVGRVVASQLGIYKIISGAFGAFRAEVINSIKGWDIGPGLDGDITVKVRKSGYKTVFEPSAVCLTSAPSNFKILTKQRMRWSKSIVRFRIRKHFDIFLPNENFRWLNFLASAENLFYNLILDIAWWFYVFDLLFHFSGQLQFIIPMNFTIYTLAGLLQMFGTYLYSERRKEELKLWPYIPLMSIYTGTYLRTVRTISYFQEIFFKKSYDDPWNPAKSSMQAKINGF